jgi:hypothetical protein
MDVIRAWYESQSPEIQAAFIAVTQTLNAQPKNQWSEKLYKPLEKRSASRCVGLTELLLDNKDPKVCARVLAYCGPREGTITMLFGFDKTADRRYGEPCATAQERKGEVERDWTRAKPIWLIDD